MTCKTNHHQYQGLQSGLAGKQNWAKVPALCDSGQIKFFRCVSSLVKQRYPCQRVGRDKFSSVQSLSSVRLFVIPWTAACQASLSSPTPEIYSNSFPLQRWCHLTMSSSVVPFSSCLQSFPASGSFPMSQFFASGAQVLEFQLHHQSFQWIFRTNFP